MPQSTAGEEAMITDHLSKAKTELLYALSHDNMVNQKVINKLEKIIGQLESLQ